MRYLLTTVLLLGAAMNLHADTYLYVSMAPEEKIQIYRLETDSGKLTSAGSYGVAGAPGSLAFEPRRKLLAASLRSTSALASLRVDPENGGLQGVSITYLPKNENAAYVAIDRTGRWLVSASYMGGKIVVHHLEDSKKDMGPPVQTITTTKTAHCVVFDRDNRWVFVPHVAPNAVYQYRFDAEKGMLTDAGQAPGGAPNAGPRHLAFHPTLNVAYTSDEVGNSVTAYQFDPKTGLKPTQTLSTLPHDFQGKNTTAEVKVHPSGKFVWVSNRGHDSLARFRVDEAGKLSALGQTPTEKTPRSFEISPDGRYVFGAGEGSGKLAVYRVDVETGALTRIHTYDVGKSLTWVMAVKLK